MTSFFWMWMRFEGSKHSCKWLGPGYPLLSTRNLPYYVTIQEQHKATGLDTVWTISFPLWYMLYFFQEYLELLNHFKVRLETCIFPHSHEVSLRCYWKISASQNSIQPWSLSLKHNLLKAGMVMYWSCTKCLPKHMFCFMWIKSSWNV